MRSRDLPARYVADGATPPPSHARVILDHLTNVAGIAPQIVQLLTDAFTVHKRVRLDRIVATGFMPGTTAHADAIAGSTRSLHSESGLAAPFCVFNGTTGYACAETKKPRLRAVGALL